MKRLITVAMLCAATMCAAETADKKSDKTTAATRTVTIPKDAVRNPDGTYSYTDKDGKKWVYNNTPFGVIRTPASGADSQGAPDPTSAATKVIDKGDTVRFERPGPFGVLSWEKKKSDLTDAERRMVDAQATKSDAK